MVVHGRAGRLSLKGIVSQKHPNWRGYDACQTVDLATCTVYNGRPDCRNVIDSAGTPANLWGLRISAPFTSPTC
jgi:hypothetical protein